MLSSCRRSLLRLILPGLSRHRWMLLTITYNFKDLYCIYSGDIYNMSLVFPHLWSLSLEEQYYLVLPALIALTPRRYWLPGGALLLALSLGLCWALVEVKPIATFFLLPTRAWELGIGSLAALVQQQTTWSENPKFKAAVHRAFCGETHTSIYLYPFIHHKIQNLRSMDFQDRTFNGIFFQ